MYSLKTMAHHLLLPFLLVAGVAPGITACSEEEETPVNPEEVKAEKTDSVEVEFVLGLGENSVLTTRSEDSESTGGDDDDSSTTTTSVEEDVNGSEAENYIDFDKLHIYVIGANTNNLGGSPAKQVDLTDLKHVAIGTNGEKYRITCKVSGNLPANFRLLVTANWPGEANLSSNNMALLVTAFSACYNYPLSEGVYAPSVEDKIGIPMYGIKTFSSIETGKQKYNLGTVELVRSMVKIIVRSEQEISNVKLTNCDKMGRCAPYNMYDNTTIPTETFVASSADAYTNHVNVVGVVTTSYQTTELYESVPFQKTTEKNTYVIYVPEHINRYYTYLSDSWYKGLTITPAYITFSANDMSFKMACEDNNGNAFSLVRNHMYIFEVSLKSKYLKYVVKDYASYTADDIIFD